jgi:hypothetical protein
MHLMSAGAFTDQVDSPGKLDYSRAYNRWVWDYDVEEDLDREPCKAK